MNKLAAFEALEQLYETMAHAAARKDWDALARIELDAAELRKSLEADTSEIPVTEQQLAAACIERLQQLDQKIRDLTTPFLMEARQALTEAREAVALSARSSALQRAYSAAGPK